MFNLFGIRVTFKGNLAAGIGGAINDELKCFSDLDIKEAELERDMLNNCLPPSKWFSKKAYTKAIYHMKKGDYESAIAALDTDVIGKVENSCIWIFQKVIIEVVKQCPKLLSAALPTTYY